MIRLRSILVFAATITLVVACEAQFQPAPMQAASPSPLVPALLWSIDHPNLVAELKLSDDQVKKLVARRQEVWDEKYQTAPKKFAENEAKRAEATNERFKAILSAEQYKRAVQLAAQHVLLSDNRIFNVPNKLTNVDAAALESYPELVTVFQLTETQKAELAVAVKNPAPVKGNGFPTGKKGFGPFSQRAAIAVSQQQTAAAIEFLGPIFTKGWKNTANPRDAFDARTPPKLLYTASADVRDDLEMTKEQYEKYMTAREKLTTAKGRQAGEASPKEMQELTRKQYEGSEKALAENLTPAQAARLKQIVFQAGHPNRTIEYLYKIPQIAAELEIGDDQVKKLDGVWQAFHDDLAKAFNSDADFEGIEKRLKELIKDRQARARAMLNPNQAAKFQTLVGEPFLGNFRQRTELSRPNESPSMALERAVAFGRYSMEFMPLAENKNLQRELKMTAEQVKKAVDVWDQLERTYSNSRLQPRRGGTNEAENVAYAKMFEERSKTIETSLGQLLTAEQARRFREIMLQYFNNPRESGLANQNGTIHPVAYPGVAETVKLTEEQKKSLLAGTSPYEVLTFEQKKAIVKMLGEPFASRISLFRVPNSPRWLAPKSTEGPSFIRLMGVGGGGGSPSPPADYAPPGLQSEPDFIHLSAIRATSLKETLKLTVEQSKIIDAAIETYHIRTLLKDPRAWKLMGFMEGIPAVSFAEATEGVLTAEQKTRLSQLIVQVNASRSLAGALAESWTAKSLDLTPEQIAQVRTREQDSLYLCDAIVNLKDPDENLIVLLRSAIDNRLLSLLTEAQRAKWKELTGEPWRGLQPRLPVQVSIP
jgi:hypothetical protein